MKKPDAKDTLSTPDEGEGDDTYWDIVKNGFPTSLSIISQLIILTINFSRLSDSGAKAGLGLSGVLVHALGGSLIVGFNYGYGIFAAKAFGAKNYDKYKLYFAQGLLNLAILLTVFTVICLFTYRIAKLTGQEQEVSVYTYEFVVYILPGYICFYTSHFVRLFVNSQNIYSPNFYVDACSIVLHIIVSWVVSFFTSQQTLVFVSTNITLVCYFLIMLFVERRFSVWKLSLELLEVKEYFTEYGNFWKECFFIAFPYSLSMFIFEILALYVGSFKNTAQTAAHVIVTNLNTLMVAPYLGFFLFMTTRIGNYIGQNRPDAVIGIIKKAVKFSIVLIYVIYALVMIFLDNIISFYSDDERVGEYIRPVLKFMLIFFVVDILQNSGAQFYKPLGYGIWVTKVYTLSFYAIGFGSTLIFARLIQNKILAVWIGLFVGCISLATFCGLKIRQIDMVQLVDELHNKVKKEGDLEIPLNEIPSH